MKVILALTVPLLCLYTLQHGTLVYSLIATFLIGAFMTYGIFKIDL